MREKLLYRYMTWWRFHCMSFLQNSLHLLPSLPFISYSLYLLSAAEEILRYRMVVLLRIEFSAWDSMKMIFRFLVHHKIFSHGIDVLFSSCLLVSIAKKKQRKLNFFGYQCLKVTPVEYIFFGWISVRDCWCINILKDLCMVKNKFKII